MKNSLLTSYLNTLFWVNNFESPILIGQNSKEADEFIKKNQLSQWAYITAYNPLSSPLSEDENETRNLQLRALLENYVVLEGQGCDVDKLWPSEKSFFVAGIPMEKAIELAQLFEQNAIVYGKLHQPAELIITSDFLGEENQNINHLTF